MGMRSASSSPASGPGSAVTPRFPSRWMRSFSTSICSSRTAASAFANSCLARSTSLSDPHLDDFRLRDGALLESCHVELHQLFESLPILDGDIDVVSGQERIEVQPLYGGNPAPHRIRKLGLCRGHRQSRDVLPQLALASKLH